MRSLSRRKWIVATEAHFTVLLILVLCLAVGAATGAEEPASLILKVTSPLPCPKVPMDPTIDFAAYIREAGLPGMLDPNSIAVVDVKTGESVPCAITEDFAYGDKGRVEWSVYPFFSHAAVTMKARPAYTIEIRSPRKPS
jgi:hypothetical protein